MSEWLSSDRFWLDLTNISLGLLVAIPVLALTALAVAWFLAGPAKACGCRLWSCLRGWGQARE